MPTSKKHGAKGKAEFGDFQTPLGLATSVCSLLATRHLQPASILEPTCGRGSFLLSALDHFPSATRAIGLDINSDYIRSVTTALRSKRRTTCQVEVKTKNFFEANWPQILDTLPDPLLIIGNPPWVTNAALGALGSSNLPEKTNFQKHAGFDAVTGKSNFDISEWMLIRITEWIEHRQATLAMLCKTTVARKVLTHAWKNNLPIGRADIYHFDASKHFGAAVDACLLVCTSSPAATPNHDCLVHASLADAAPVNAFGFRDSRILADIAAYESSKHLEGRELYKWRSGIKHDCAPVMELFREGSHFRNGLDELVELEEDYLYPMLKSSEIANGATPQPSRWMLVTQKFIGQPTAPIAENAPKTWHYLQKHIRMFARRASSIYENRPTFSIFGVGDYSFSPWKVAISGFYKTLKFAVVGPHAGKPVMLDDTGYFIACSSSEEAEYLAFLLNSEIVSRFLRAYCFLDAKRPVTTELLRRLDIAAVASELGTAHILEEHLRNQFPQKRAPKARAQTLDQGCLFESAKAPLTERLRPR